MEIAMWLHQMSDETKKQMNKEFIPYEPSMDLKELGFNEPCFGYYNNMGGYIDEYGKLNSSCNKPGMHGKYCTAPLYQQVFRWFREKYNIDGFVQIEPLNKKYGYVTYDRKKGNYTESERKYIPEEAELACLIKLIEIVKTK